MHCKAIWGYSEPTLLEVSDPVNNIGDPLRFELVGPEVGVKVNGHLAEDIIEHVVNHPALFPDDLPAPLRAPKYVGHLSHPTMLIASSPVKEVEIHSLWGNAEGTTHGSAS